MKILHLLTGLTLLAAGTAVAETDPADGFFPYVKGRYWLYDGTVKFLRDQAVVEKKITGWKSEVLDTVEGEDFKAALLKGSPNDLAWYKDDKKPGISIVILTKNGEFHDLRNDADAASQFATIKSTGKLPADLIGDGDVLFKTSMKEGDRFGDPEQTKLGARYCWVVANVVTGKPETQVRGIPADKGFKTFTLTYRSSPDHTNVKFAAGLGVTYFEYVHHGTPGSCEMQLVEIGEQKPAP